MRKRSTVLMLSVLMIAVFAFAGCTTTQMGAGGDLSMQMASAKAVSRQPIQGPAAFGIGAAAKKCKCQL